MQRLKAAYFECGHLVIFCLHFQNGYAELVAVEPSECPSSDVQHEGEVNVIFLFQTSYWS